MKKEYEAVNELLLNRLSEKKFLIAVHRGVSGGNIIENTYSSSRLSLEMGGDMFEIDLSNSTDSELYLFHDGGEKRLLNIEKNIKELSSREIDELEFRNSLGEPSGRGVEHFSSFLEKLDDDWLFNIDRSWWFLPDVDRIMKDYPERIRQAVIKTHVDDDALSFFSRCERKYMYMPIVYKKEHVDKVLATPDINLVGMEVIAFTPESDMISDEMISYIRSKGLYVWVNVIKLGAKDKHIIGGGYDDDKALEENPDASWGPLIKKGVNVLQTDWPWQMKLYRDSL